MKKITLKNKGELKDLLFHEGYDVLAFWKTGDWASVGSGYGGEQDGNNPIFLFRRINFYDTTKREAAVMARAIELSIQNGTDPHREYEILREKEE